jgi:hypothetical protein
MLAYAGIYYFLELEMKNKSLIFASLVIVSLCALFTTGCFSTAPELKHQGIFGEDVLIPAKDFESKGLVFTEVQMDLTSANEIQGDIFTYQALLKEAQRLGADAIINVVIDKLSRDVTEGINTKHRVTWYGSALAIKYTDVLRETVIIKDESIQRGEIYLNNSRNTTNSF